MVWGTMSKNLISAVESLIGSINLTQLEPNEYARDIVNKINIVLLEIEQSKKVSRPLPPGMLIDYLGMRATVILDTGGNELRVNSDGSESVWLWCLDGVECTVISRPPVAVDTSLDTKRLDILEEIFSITSQESDTWKSVETNAHEKGWRYAADQLLLKK